MKFSDLHIPVTDPEAVQQLISSINEQLEGTGVYFWAQQTGVSPGAYETGEVPGDALIVLVSFNFSYYHQAEIAFHGVAAHNLPEEIWTDAHEKQLSPATGDERNIALQTLNIQDSQVPAFVFFTGHGNRYYIAAEGISWHRGMIYYYRRDSLEDGERIARFVR